MSIADKQFRAAIDGATDPLFDELVKQHRAQKNVRQLRAPRGGAADADEAEGSDADVKAASAKLADALVALFKATR